MAAELRAIHPFEQDEWAETLLVAGFKVDTSMFLVETVDGYLTDLVDHAHPDHDKQVLIAAVLDAIPLHGRALVNRWRARPAAYPDALARAMVARHLAGHSGWRHAEVLAARRDLVFSTTWWGRRPGPCSVSTGATSPIPASSGWTSSCPG